MVLPTDADHPSQPLPTANWALFATLQFLLTASLSVYGYRFVFGRFALYDDQGNMMLTLRLWLRGRRLYDEVPTPYGPFYYLIQRFLYRTLHIPLTTDDTRLVCLACWLLTAAVLGVLIYRLTGQLMLALLGETVLFFFVSFTTFEPSHPQEQLLVELALLLLLTTRRAREERWVAGGMGVLCACMLLTKLNVGIFAVAACGMSILAVSDLRRADTVVRITASVLVLIIPARLMVSAWGTEPWTGFTVSETLSIAAMALVCFRPKAPAVWGPGPALTFGAAIGGTVIAIVAPFAVMGSTLHGFVDSTWVMAQRQVSAFTFYPLMPGDQTRWAILATAPSLIFLFRPLARVITGKGALAVSGVKVVAGIYGLSLLVPDWNTAYAPSRLPPLLWLVLLETRLSPRSRNPVDRFPRATLAWMAVMQPMWLFPVGGTQRFPASAIAALAMIVCLGDGLRDLYEWTDIVAPIGQAVSVVGLFAATCWYSSLYPTLKDYDRQFRQGVSLGLPGAVRTRTDATTAADLRLLTQTLSANCDSFLASDGFNSLYFWTGQSPPASLVVSHPLEYFTPAQQSQLLESLVAHRRSCFIIERTGFPHDTPEMPIFLKQVRQYYKPWCRIGFCDLLVRASRITPPIPPGATVIPTTPIQHVRPRHRKR